jgi:hypothetical protein
MKTVLILLASHAVLFSGGAVVAYLNHAWIADKLGKIKAVFGK